MAAPTEPVDRWEQDTGSQQTRLEEWIPSLVVRPYCDPDDFRRILEEMWEWPACAEEAQADDAEYSLEERFRQLANDWSENTRHVSSSKDLASYPSYREIIGLGWDVVPLLLKDLEENKRFWFPALYAITNVRPFDPSDAGNGRRMTEAWVRWGKRKGLI